MKNYINTQGFNKNKSRYVYEQIHQEAEASLKTEILNKIFFNISIEIYILKVNMWDI